MSSEIGGFGRLVGALTDNSSMFPKADADDLERGARYIPDEVTDARRARQTVEFITEGDESAWYWQMPDGSRIEHRL